MKNRLRTAALTLSLLACIPMAGARPALLTGAIAHQNASALTSQINWYSSLGQAENEAQREGKMVFWVHMLGSLSGAT